MESRIGTLNHCVYMRYVMFADPSTVPPPHADRAVLATMYVNTNKLTEVPARSAITNEAVHQPAC